MSRTVELIGADEAEELMSKLPIEIRGKKMVAAMRSSGNIVKKEMKRRVPKGNPDHKPHLKALRDTLAVKVKQHDKGIYMIAGAQYPAGAHTHLVEKGHEVVVNRGPNKGLRTGMFAAPKEFVAPAIDTTKTQARQVLLDRMEKIIMEAGG